MQETFSFYSATAPAVEEWPRPGMSPEYIRVPALSEINESLKPYNKSIDALEEIDELRATVNGMKGYFPAVQTPQTWEMNSAYLSEILSTNDPMFRLPFGYGGLENYGIWHELFKPFMGGGLVVFYNSRPCLKADGRDDYGERSGRRITREDVKRLAEQLCETERGMMIKYVSDNMREFFKNPLESRPLKTRERYGGKNYISNDYTYAAARNAADLLAFMRYMSRSEKGTAPVSDADNAMKDGGEWRTEWFTATPQKNGAANVALSGQAVAFLNELRETYYAEYLQLIAGNH
jgi:hypothetical protein